MRSQVVPRVVDGVEHWKCTKCMTWFTRDCFYKDSRRSHGLKSHCKSCHSEMNIKTRDKDNTRRLRRESMSRKRAEEPERYRERERLAARKREKGHKYRARYQLNLAVKRGDIKRPDRCQHCGTESSVEGHHEDYDKPFDVTWLCPLCHGKVHRKS